MKLTWRKLLSDPPSSWMRLPMITRGIGDEILRAVDASGEIDCGAEAPSVVVCRLAAAHPRERRRIVEGVDELIAAGFLSITDRDGSAILAVVMPDLSLARGAPKAAPKRTRSEREADVNPARSGREADAKLTRSQREVELKPAEPFDSGPVEEKRTEQKRTEQITPSPLDARALPPEAAPSTPAPRAPRADVVDVFEHWRAKLGKGAAAKLDRKREARIRWALDTYGVDAVKRCIDGYAGDPWTLGQNDRGKRFDDIELFLRDAQRVERGWAMAERGPRLVGRLPPSRFSAEDAQRSMADFDALVGPGPDGVANG